MRNDEDRLTTCFWPYLSQFLSVLHDIGLVLKLAGSNFQTRTPTCGYPTPAIPYVHKRKKAKPHISKPFVDHNVSLKPICNLCSIGHWEIAGACL